MLFILASYLLSYDILLVTCDAFPFLFTRENIADDDDHVLSTPLFPPVICSLSPP